MLEVDLSDGSRSVKRKRRVSVVGDGGEVTA